MPVFRVTISDSDLVAATDEDEAIQKFIRVYDLEFTSLSFRARKVGEDDDGSKDIIR